MEASEGLVERQITAQAQKALIALQKCLQVAGRHAQLVEAQVARFNLWATNIGVFAKYKASLDFRLRDSPDVQRIIINLLDILGIYAGQAIRIESASFGQDGVTSASSLSVAGRQTEVFGGDAQQAFQIRPLKDLTIIPAYQAVDDTIGRLHRLSTAIRNAGTRNPYSRIARLTVVDEDGNDINDLFESFIARVLEVRFSCISSRLRRRIGDAICFRRRRFIYNRPSGQRNGHQFVPLAFPDEPKASHLLAPPASLERMTGALGQIVPQAFTNRTASTFHPHRFQNPRLSEPSVASTATAPSYVPRMDESIPKAPSVESGQKEAQCPFCPFVISIKDLNGIRWIKHFLNDLEPYVCLFEDCMSPHQLFSSVEQWLDHMKSHPAPSTEWICSMRHSAPTETVMKSAEEFTSHMKDAHPGRFTDIQIKRLEGRAARPSPMFPNCLLCGWSVPPDAESEGRILGSLTSMEKHIADHLVDLALLSLPPRQGTERDDEVSMKTSGNASLNSGKRLSHSALSHDLSGFDLHNDQELLPDEERTSGMNQERDGPVPSFPSAGPEFRSPHHPDEEGQASANLPLQEQGRDRRSLPSQITVPELSIVPEPVPTQSPDSSIPPPPPHDALTQMGDQLPPQRSIFTCSWENCPYSSETGTLEDFLRHVERVHTSSSGYVCPVAGCGLSYSRMSALSEHKIGHYDSVPSLETSSVARQNERSTTDSPILCKWHGCLRTEHFLSSVDLLEHITAVHIGSRDLIGTRNDLDETTNSQDTPQIPQSSLISHALDTTSPSTPTPAGPPPPSHTPTYSSHLAFGATQTQYPAPHLPRTQPDTTPTNVYSPRPSISHARNPSVGTEYDGASNGYSYPQPRVQNERSAAYPKTALPPLRLGPPKPLNMQRSSETRSSDPNAYQSIIQPPAPRSQTPLAPSLPPLRSLFGDISNNPPQPQNGMVQSPGLDLTGGKKLLWETNHSVSKRSYGDTFGHDERPLYRMRPDPENYAASKPPSDIEKFVIPASEAPAQDLLPALHSPDNNHTLPSLQTALGLSSVPKEPRRPKGSSPLSLPPVTAASPPSLRSELVWEQPRTAPFCAQAPPPSPYSHWSPASTTVGNVSAVSSPASQNSHWRSLKSEISNGIQWLAFESVQDRVRMGYTIRCDIKSVNVDSLSQEFKTENCVYPRAYCSKNQYRGNRWEYETEFNAVGWALAELNPTLRGKRGLIQRAVDSWRNSIQNPLLRSRRVQRISKTNRARDPFSPEPETEAPKDEPSSGPQPAPTGWPFVQDQSFQEAISDPIQSAEIRSTPLFLGTGDVSGTKRPFVDISPAHDGSEASVSFKTHAQEPSASVIQDPDRARRIFLYGSAEDHDHTSFDDKKEGDDLLDGPPPPPRRRRGSFPRVLSNSIFGDEEYYRRPTQDFLPYPTEGPSAIHRDEDYGRMPIPPSKHKATPNTIRIRPDSRKVATAPSTFPDRRSPRPTAAAAAQEQQQRPEVMEEKATDTDIIQCICQFSHDDGSTILCDKCGTWQHIICYYDGLNVPETHMCGDCQPRPLDVGRAKDLQEQHLERVQLASQREDDGPRARKRSRKDRKKDRKAAATFS